jgi:nitric-oxide synthase
MDATRDYFLQANWQDSAICQELFSLKLDEEDKAKTPVRQVIQLAGGITPVEQDSIRPLAKVLVYYDKHR